MPPHSNAPQMHFEGLEAPPCPPMKTIISYLCFHWNLKRLNALEGKPLKLAICSTRSFLQGSERRSQQPHLTCALRRCGRRRRTALSCPDSISYLLLRGSWGRREGSDMQNSHNEF
jgi:hypothetical protein